jgi:alpha-1,2-mannosyltransferase
MTTTVERHLSSRQRELERAFANVLLGVIPAVLTAFLVLTAFRYRSAAYDFHWSYYPAARRLLDGGDPYAVTSRDIQQGIAFVYPALSAIVLAPFALVGRSLADHLYMLLCFLLVPATLWVSGVRDWRVYGLPFLWLPVVVGWQGGNFSVPLTFLVAVVWRYRDRPATAGFAAALAISLKPFVWPLALWLLATRRWRAAAWAIASGAAFNLIAWGLVGFNEIHVYLRLSSEVTKALWRGGYSVLAVAHHLGFGRGVGEVLLVIGSASLLAGIVYVGFLKRQEREAMVLAVALMLVASPLVWSHYFVLLLVPLAITRPRLSPLWLVPIVMWVCPPSTTVTGLEAAVAWLAAAICLRSAFAAPVRRAWMATA